MESEKVTVEDVVESAKRIIIRLDLGNFVVTGPRANILKVESLVAFSTTVNELYHEGYQMVSREQYAEEYGAGIESVDARIKEEGNLFALVYAESVPPSVAVPLDERDAVELGPHLH